MLLLAFLACEPPEPPADTEIPADTEVVPETDRPETDVPDSDPPDTDVPDTDPPDTDVPCEPPVLTDADPAWDLGAWLASHERPEVVTSQSGNPDPAPFTLEPGEIAAFREAWEAFVGPIPESCVDLDLRVEPLDLTPDELALVDTAAYTLSKVSFAGAHGERVPAYLSVPNGLMGPAPAVVVIHQSTMACGKKEPIGVCGAYNLDFARDLAQRGYVTLAYDSVGFGERAVESWNFGYEYADGARPLTGFPDATLTGLRISDAGRAIDALRSLPEVDPDRIGLIGHSNGGIEALFTAAFDDRVSCTVSNAGPNLVRRETYDFLGITPGIARWAGYGYLPAMGFWDGDAAGLPVEMHQLYAMVAPRGLFVALVADDTVAPDYDRIGFAFGEAERAYSEIGGDFVGHEVASGLTPECRDEWALPLCAGSLYEGCLAAGDTACLDDFAALGLTPQCVADDGVAYNCVWRLWWQQCRASGGSYEDCAAPWEEAGADATCVDAAFLWGCRRDHGWYPETEALVYPWLDTCMGL